MELIIKNRLITAPIEEILYQIRYEVDGKYLKQINRPRGDTIAVTCPWHKDGQENRPSCFIYTDRYNKDIYYGTAHCFTCGAKRPLYNLVGTCFDKDDDFGKEWLLERFGDTLLDSRESLFDEINFDEPVKEQVNILDESILDSYCYYHPYMEKRHLNIETINKYKIGYDIENKAITFPVWDEKDNLVMITRRSVTGKKYELATGINKPIYLLNYALKENTTTLYIAESQINALTLNQWGYTAVAMLGTGSKYQYEILKNCGIRNYVLCFDGDDAGDKGADRFVKNLSDKAFISKKELPRGKDINDISKEEFDNLKLTFY